MTSTPKLARQYDEHTQARLPARRSLTLARQYDEHTQAHRPLQMTVAATFFYGD